jgi:alpha-L-fucosidase
MKKKNVFERLACWVLVFLFSSLSVMASEGDSFGKSGLEDPDSKRMEWYNDAKFGLFIHWGLYSIPAGVWNGEEQKAGYAEHIMRTEQIPIAEYEKLAEQFNPINYDPEQIAELADKAGMKYLVITAKHHDGFAMYHSKSDPYNVVDATPYNKDILKPLFDAFRKRGIKVGFYYSQAQDWHEKGGSGNMWDFPTLGKTRKANVMMPYIQSKVIPQLTELLTDYGKIDLIWFDTPNGINPEMAQLLHDTVKGIQPDCLISGRLIYKEYSEQYASWVDYASLGDNANITSPQGFPWESCMTMNHSWGFKTSDHKWKPTREFLVGLATTAANGGTLLLNIGPKADGTVPEPSVQILTKIGQWMEINGESIYQTKPSPFDQFFPWGYVTQRDGKVYLHVLNWKSGNRLILPGVQTQIDGATVLGHDELGASVTQADGAVQITLDGNFDNSKPHPVVVLTHQKGLLKVEASEIREVDGKINLLPALAKVAGEGKTIHSVNYGNKGQVMLQMRTTNKPNEAQWNFDVAQPGTYDLKVRVKYIHQPIDPKVMFMASLNGEEQFEFNLPTTWEGEKWMTLGSVEIETPGSNELSFYLNNIKGKVAWRVLHFSEIVLEKQ